MTAPFWNAVSEGRLHVQYCKPCQRAVFYPRLACPHCGGGDLDWKDMDPRGRLETFTVVHRAAPEYQEWVPYAVGIGDFDGARMFGVLDRTERLAVGDPIRFVGGDDVRKDLEGMPTPYFFSLDADR